MTPQFRRIIYNLKKKWKIQIVTFAGAIAGYRIYDNNFKFQLDLWKNNNTYDLIIKFQRYRYHGSCNQDRRIYYLIQRHLKK